MKDLKYLAAFSIPIMETADLQNYLKEHSEFHVYKVKINEENGPDFIKTISKLTTKPLRIDANEAFTKLSAYKNFEYQIKKLTKCMTN